MTRILIICAALAASTVLAGEPDKDLHEKCIYPSVMVVNNNPLSKAIGSGVTIKCTKQDKKHRNLVFTCAHILMPIVEPEEPADPPPPEGIPVAAEAKPEKYDILVKIGSYEDWSTLVGIKEYQAEVLFVDRIKDIALLCFSTEDALPVAEVDKSPKLYIGNDVLRLGCGLEEPFRLDYGKITSVKNSVGTMLKGTYRVSIPTVLGDSGGPVYHKNKLIGVAQAIRTIPAYAFPHPVNIPVYNMTYVIPIKTFYDCEGIAKILEE